MKHLLLIPVLVSLGCGGGQGASSSPLEAEEVVAKADELSLNELSMEVTALQAIYEFDLTTEQMKKLRQLAPETSQKARERKPGKATEAFRKALVEFRQALLEASDVDQIERAEEKVDELRDQDKPDLDDDVSITYAARTQTAAVLRSLTQEQVAHYVDHNMDDIHDPVEHLVTALDKIRKLKGEEFEELRDEVAGEVAVLAAGIKADKVEEVKKKTADWLNRAHALAEDDFKAKRPEFEKTATQIVGQLTMAEASNNFVANAVAELLSNPRLGSALDGRLKK
jgi:hypothetical protein